MNTQLEQLLTLPNVWQASRVRRQSSVLSTGYGEVDAQLHDGGWPDNATTELLTPGIGIGELRLLIPGLRQAQAQRPWLVFIAPPQLPCAAALAQQSLNPEGVLIIKPRNPKDLLWCAEQTLQSGCCGAMVTWANGVDLNSRQLRRLQQAAHRGQCWHVLVRHPRVQQQPSPSALRIQLKCSAQGLLQLDILKQRGGWSGQSITVRLQPDLSQLRSLAPDQLPLPLAQLDRHLPAQGKSSLIEEELPVANGNVVPLTLRR